jgi:DNA-binding response OmpR family regulator
MTRHLRTAVVVSSPSDQSHTLDVLFDALDYDVVVVESPDRAYARVKRLLPDLVIVCFDFNDPSAFQLMSMLSVDRMTSSIPMMTCNTAREPIECDEAPAEYDGPMSTGPLAFATMN